MLSLATFMFLITGSTSKWARPIGIALTGATPLAPTSRHTFDGSRRSSCSKYLRGSLALIGFDSSGDGTAALLNAALVAVAPGSAITRSALVAVAPVAIARSVLCRRVIDVRTILAALCVYVLRGMLWAYLYTTIGNIGTGTFFAQSLEPTSAAFLYFSFITMLTVGDGDLTAGGNLGRACAVLEV